MINSILNSMINSIYSNYSTFLSAAHAAFMSEHLTDRAALNWNYKQ